MLRRWSLVLAVAALLGLTGATLAASGTPYALVPGAVSAGGAGSAGGGYRLQGEVVTVAAGVSAGDVYRVEGGFLAGAAPFYGRVSIPLIRGK